MSLVYVGELTIGDLLPGIAIPFIQAVGDLQARLDACIAAMAQITVGMPSLSLQIQLALDIIANLQAAIAVGITPPTVSVQISVMVALIAQLEAELAIMLGIPFSTAGVHVYAYDGTVGAFGGEVTTALSAGVPGGAGPGQHCDAIVLATVIPTTWAALSLVFKVSP